MSVVVDEHRPPLIDERRERLWTMTTAGPNFGGLAAAMVVAQAALKNPAFDNENPAFHSRFASLAAIRNAVVPALNEAGIAVLQNLTTNAEGVACETILLHSGGEMLRLGPFTVPLMKRDAWATASAATYARRISLQAVACIVGDDDDDGAAAQDIKHTKANPRDGMDLDGVDQTLAEEYAASMTDIMGANDPGRAKALHDELNGFPELYIVAGDKLPAKARREWKALVARAKA